MQTKVSNEVNILRSNYDDASRAGIALAKQLFAAEVKIVELERKLAFAEAKTREWEENVAVLLEGTPYVLASGSKGIDSLCITFFGMKGKLTRYENCVHIPKPAFSLLKNCFDRDIAQGKKARKEIWEEVEESLVE